MAPADEFKSQNFTLTTRREGERGIVALTGELDLHTADQFTAADHPHRPARDCARGGRGRPELRRLRRAEGGPHSAGRGAAGGRIVRRHGGVRTGGPAHRDHRPVRAAPGRLTGATATRPTPTSPPRGACANVRDRWTLNRRSYSTRSIPGSPTSCSAPTVAWPTASRATSGCAWSR